MVSYTFCACVKAEVKCSIACHGNKNSHGGPTSPNISSARIRGQRGLKDRNREEEAQDDQGESKRQRKDTGGKFAKSRKLKIWDSKMKGIQNIQCLCWS